MCVTRSVWFGVDQTRRSFVLVSVLLGVVGGLKCFHFAFSFTVLDEKCSKRRRVSGD